MPRPAAALFIAQQVDPAFEISVKTDNSGVSADNQFQIPQNGALSYNFDIDWGDDNVETVTTNTNKTHTYGSAGTYTIRITENVVGGFPSINFNNGGDKLKIMDISNWGAGQWDTFSSSFRGCTNLTGTAQDTPDLSIVTDATYIFRECSALSFDFTNWDVSSIDNFYGFFRQVPNLTFSEIAGWNTASASNFTNMFVNATLANPDVSGWNISTVSNCTDMFLNSGFSNENYDALLIAWAAKSHWSNVPFHAGSAKYSAGAAATARAALVADGWTITDGGPA